MRIIAGQWRGRQLEAPDKRTDKNTVRGSLATRPTSDRLREAIFSMITSRVGDFAGLRVADLCAGSGALGIEALSRGAAQCLFIDNNRQALARVRANLARLDGNAAGQAVDSGAVMGTRGALARAEIRAGSLGMLSLSAGGLDVIFLDPPYRLVVGVEVLDRIAGWLAPNGWLAFETSLERRVESTLLTIAAERVFGRSKITLLNQLNQFEIGNETGDNALPKP